MPWDDGLQRFGASEETAYIAWSASNQDSDLEPSYLRGTKQGYVRWIGRRCIEKPELYERAKKEFAQKYPFQQYFADHSWHPGPVERNKKNKPPPKYLFSYAGEVLPATMTIPDSKVLGGYRTVPITATSGTVGDFDDMVTAEESEISVWNEKVSHSRALANAMLEEAQRDRSVLISKLARPIDSEDAA